MADESGITDATLNTGVFQPKGSSFVWLFVTDKQAADCKSAALGNAKAQVYCSGGQ